MYCLVRVIVIIAIISIVVIFIIILLEWALQDEPIVKLNQSAPPRYFPLSISIPPLTPGHLQITWITLELFFSLPWNFFISLSPFFQRSGLRSLEIFELIMFLCHRHFQPTCSNFATFWKDKIENNNYNNYNGDNYTSNNDLWGVYPLNWLARSLPRNLGFEANPTLDNDNDLRWWQQQNNNNDMNMNHDHT